MLYPLDANRIKNLPYDLAYAYTGHDFKSGSGTNWAIPTTVITGVVLGVVGHKIANKVGINRYLKKLTLGYISL